MEENNSVKKVHAPYNFVPFSNRLIKRYERIQDLPHHDKIDPNLKTGEIHVCLRAEMPIYISNGKGGSQEDFFKGADGTYQIPGSSVRGMLRENMQILGMGLVRPDEDVEDYQIYFRDVGSSNKSVNGDKKKAYQSALGINGDEENKKKKGRGETKGGMTPPNVHSGFLRKENGEFYIQPSEYYRVSRKNEGMNAFKKNGEIPPAAYFEVAFSDDGSWVRRIVPLREKEPGMKTGTLLSTGKPVGSKENALYVINNEAKGEEILVKSEDVTAYQIDLESRKNALEGGYKTTEFWELPKEGERKAVFYAEHNGHIFFGMSLFLRVGYPHKISEGLPDNHKEKAAEETNGPFLDYPASIMGFAAKDCAYRSRVSVGNFSVRTRKPCQESYDTIGAEPKPSYCAGYLKDGKSYADEKFQLRGYKQYWMREKIYRPARVKNEKMGGSIRPFDTGTVFEGVIRFKNLHEDELGLLLWALLLEDGCYQSLGKGRPYGMGRVSVQIKKIEEINAAQRYTVQSFSKPVSVPIRSAKEYIAKYKKYVSELLETEKRKNSEKNGKKASKKAEKIEEQSRIQDFFFMHRISALPENEMTYMELKEYQNTREYQKELRDLRKEAEEKEKRQSKKEERKIGDLDFSNFKFNVRS